MIITIYSSQRNQSELEYVLHVLLENKINVINSKQRKVIKKLAIVYFFRRVKCNNREKVEQLAKLRRNLKHPLKCTV